nr:transcription factor bHLH162-like [Solanum lycopersicum]
MKSNLKSKLGPKLERKDVEKNRRNYMKNLCNQLYSLIPFPNASTSSSKETMAVPDQIDAAINYIESLKMNLEKNKKSTPQIEFHEMGPNIVVVLIIGLDNIATFNNIIRLCYMEGVEVVSTRFELNGNSTIQISHETKVLFLISLGYICYVWT